MYFVCRPLAVAVVEEPGKIWERADAEIRALPSDDVRCRKLFCLLPRAEGQRRLDPLGCLEEWLASQNRNVVWMLVQPPDEELPWVNPDWWKVSQALGDAGLCCLADNK
jgi:hypothetical protein